MPVSSVKMMIPLVKYRMTGREQYLIDTCIYMSLSKEVLDRDTLDTVRDSFAHVKTKVGMPSNVSRKRISKYHAPTLVIAAEKDCLFPAGKVLPRAKKLIHHCKVHMLKNSGHLHILPQEEKHMIVEFLLSNHS